MSVLRRARSFNVTPLRIPLSVLGALFVVASFVPGLATSHGYDLTSYWLVDLDYANVTDLSGEGPFRYAPAVALVMAPLRLLPWEGLVGLWLALQLGALWYIGRSWFLVLVLFPPVWLDIVYGNINIFLAAMIVGGFRYPALWAFAFLTKVTPGVGVVWFAARREWRSLAIALGATVGIALVSVVLQGPQLWLDWMNFLVASSGYPLPADALPVPLILRVIAAAGIAAWAGLTDRRWLVPVAVTLAMPTLWVISLAPLVAIAGLVRLLDPTRLDRRYGPGKDAVRRSSGPHPHVHEGQDA
jgi:hypothetical protein